MQPLTIAKIVGGIAALFGGALVLKEAKETTRVVPDTVNALRGLALPVTLVAAALLIRTWKA